MKLSEAIRLGAMMKPQAFGALYDNGATCALGAAGDAMGILDRNRNDWIPGSTEKVWWWRPVATAEALCPSCGQRARNSYGWITSSTVEDVIVHLNNDHRWTRERIADWVESVEREQESATQPQEAKKVAQ